MMADKLKLHERDNTILKFLEDNKKNSAYSELYIEAQKDPSKLYDLVEKYIQARQKTLSLWFKMVYKGKASVEKLYEKGKAIEEKIQAIYPYFENINNFSDLKEALDFIDCLHDSSARSYHSKHKEEIYYYMRRLS